MSVGAFGGASNVGNAPSTSLPSRAPPLAQPAGQRCCKTHVESPYSRVVVSSTGAPATSVQSCVAAVYSPMASRPKVVRSGPKRRKASGPKPSELSHLSFTWAPTGPAPNHSTPSTTTAPPTSSSSTARAADRRRRAARGSPCASMLGFNPRQTCVGEHLWTWFPEGVVAGHAADAAARAPAVAVAPVVARLRDARDELRALRVAGRAAAHVEAGRIRDDEQGRVPARREDGLRGRVAEARERLRPVVGRIEAQDPQGPLEAVRSLVVGPGRVARGRVAGHGRRVDEVLRALEEPCQFPFVVRVRTFHVGERARVARQVREDPDLVGRQERVDVHPELVVRRPRARRLPRAVRASELRVHGRARREERAEPREQRAGELEAVAPVAVCHARERRDGELLRREAAPREARRPRVVRERRGRRELARDERAERVEALRVQRVRHELLAGGDGRAVLRSLHEGREQRLDGRARGGVERAGVALV